MTGDKTGDMTGRRVAVVGSGVAGLTAAYVLARHGGRQVTLLEADDRLGGHVDTHLVTAAGRAGDRHRLHRAQRRTSHRCCCVLRELGVETQDWRCRCRCTTRPPAWSTPRWGPGFPSRAPATSPTRRTSGCRPRSRASTGAPPHLADEADQRTLRQFLADGGFSATSPGHFAEALVACVWTLRSAVALDYLARYLFRFLDHHGMLGVFGSPRWKTIVGGSRTKERAAAALDDVRTGTKVTLGPRDRDRLEADGNGAVTSYDAGGRRRTSTRRSPCWPGRLLAQAEVLRGCPTPPTRHCCTTDAPAAASGAALARPGTTCARAPATGRSR
ncbi:MAG: FAD-dependent oxidoreductase [Nocardioides sp.]